MPKKGKQYVREDHKEGTSLIITSEYMLQVLKKEILKTVLQKNIFFHEREYYKCQRSSWPRVKIYTWCSWIRASQYNSYRNSQQDATVYQNLLFHVYVKAASVV